MVCPYPPWWWAPPFSPLIGQDNLRYFRAYHRNDTPVSLEIHWEIHREIFEYFVHPPLTWNNNSCSCSCSCSRKDWKLEKLRRGFVFGFSCLSFKRRLFVPLFPFFPFFVFFLSWAWLGFYEWQLEARSKRHVLGVLGPLWMTIQGRQPSTIQTIDTWPVSIYLIISILDYRQHLPLNDLTLVAVQWPADGPCVDYRQFQPASRQLLTIDYANPRRISSKLKYRFIEISIYRNIEILKYRNIEISMYNIIWMVIHWWTRDKV